MPKIVDHDLQRAQLLDGAFEFFADCGYAALSMRSLASRLQTTTGVLYHYFDNKNEIFEQALMRSTERHIRDALMTINLEQSLEHRLHTLVEWLVGRQDALKRTLLLALDAQRQAPDAQVTIAQAAQRFGEVLEQQIGAGSDLWPRILGALVASQLSDTPLTHVGLNALILQPGTLIEVA